MTQGVASAMETEKPGVYLLFLRQQLVYVGRSKNPLKRINVHRKNGRPFDHALHVDCEAKDVAWVERALIAALNPSQNKLGVTGPSGDPPAVVPARRPELIVPDAPEPPDLNEPLVLHKARRRAEHYRLHKAFDAAIQSGELRSVPLNPDHTGPGCRRLVTVGDLTAWLDQRIAERNATGWRAA